MSGKEYVLDVLERSELGDGASRRFRRDGQVPVNFYGKGVENVNLVANAKEWTALAKQGARLVELKSSKASYHGLIKEVQRDYLKDVDLNLDFVAVDQAVKIQTKVKVRPFGTPVGTGKGGLFEQISHEVLVECLAKDLPEVIDADVSGIELYERVRAHQLELPEGVVAVDGEKYTVFSVVPTRASRSAGTDEEDEAAE